MKIADENAIFEEVMSELSECGDNLVEHFWMFGDVMTEGFGDAPVCVSDALIKVTGAKVGEAGTEHVGDLGKVFFLRVDLMVVGDIGA